MKVPVNFSIGNTPIEFTTAPYQDHVPANPPDDYVHVPWRGTHHVQIGLIKVPNAVEWAVCQICHYAYTKKAWRHNPVTSQDEYAVEFTVSSDGFESRPELLSKNRLRGRVRLLLLQQCLERNVVLGLGLNQDICLRFSGILAGDWKRVFLDGEIVTPDNLPFRKIRVKKDMKIPASMLQEFALA